MANDRRRLEQVFGLRGQAVDAGREHGLDGRGHKQGLACSPSCSSAVLRRVPPGKRDSPQLWRTYSVCTTPAVAMTWATACTMTRLASDGSAAPRRLAWPWDCPYPGRCIPRPIRDQQQDGGTRDLLDQRHQPLFLRLHRASAHFRCQAPGAAADWCGEKSAARGQRCGRRSWGLSWASGSDATDTSSNCSRKGTASCGAIRSLRDAVHGSSHRRWCGAIQ